MIAQIGEHGEMIAAQLQNNNEVASLKEMQEQQTKERILAAILDVAGSIEAGHEAVAEAVSGGSEAVVDSLDVGQERIADTLTAGHTKISETLTAGHTKLAETGADIATAITSGDEKIEAAISQTGNSLDLIKDSVDVQSERIHSGLQAVEEAGLTNKAGAETFCPAKRDERDPNIMLSSSDRKSPLENIAATVGQAASSSDQVATSLGTLGQENKEGMENLVAAISDFMRQQTTDTITTRDPGPGRSEGWD